MQKANKSDKCFFTALHTHYFIFMLEIDNKPAHTWLGNQSQKSWLSQKMKTHKASLSQIIRSSAFLLFIFMFSYDHKTS